MGFIITKAVQGLTSLVVLVAFGLVMYQLGFILYKGLTKEKLK